MNAVQVIRRLRPFAWGLAVLALIAMVAWRAGAWSLVTGGGERSPAARDARAGLDIRPGLDLYPRNDRVPAPMLEGTTLNGESFALSDLAGQVVVMNVWGSWCAPCRAETPDLVRLANERRAQGVRFVGINTRDNPDAARAFVRTFKVPYPNVQDNNGDVLLSFRDTIPTTVVPTTVVVDRQGKIAARVIGPVTYNNLKGLLDDELAAGEGGR
jgi:thiol-disulfide isomerase/thioredoxin